LFIYASRHITSLIEKVRAQFGFAKFCALTLYADFGPAFGLSYGFHYALAVPDQDIAGDWQIGWLD
jgi:hypothetical protein